MMASKFNQKILELHADEIAFLSAQRKNIIVSPAYQLTDILYFDSRLRGNIKGLQLGGEFSWAFCLKNLEFEEAGEIFTAAVFAINCQDFSKLAAVFEIAGEDINLLDAIAEAFVWSSYEDFKLPLHKLAASKNNKKRYVAISALLSHRCQTDQFKRHVENSLHLDNLNLQQKILTAIGEMGMFDLKFQLDNLIDDGDEGIAFSAIFSATRFGDVEAMENLKQYVNHKNYGVNALQRIILQKDIDNTIEILRELFQTEETQRLSVLGLGYFGRVSSIPHLIQLMDTPALSRIAGFAFSSITGLDLEQRGMSCSQPEAYVAQRLNAEEAENVLIDPDEDLPWPDAEKIDHWWSNADVQQQFKTNESYLAGRPFSKKQLYATLRDGNQPQRLFAANCLSVYEQNRPTFNVYTPANSQLSVLKGLLNQD